MPSVEDFLRSSTPLEEPSAKPTIQQDGEGSDIERASEGGSSSGDTPPVDATTPDAPLQFTSLTPSGIEVLYQPNPRLYRVRGVGDEDWTEVPSVTSILDVVSKGGLPGWGQKTAIAGLNELCLRGIVHVDMYGQFTLTSSGISLSIDDLLVLLKQHKLDIDSVRDSAGDRGTSVHDALETYFETGFMPQPDVYPETERGYVEGLVKFLKDVEGKLEPLQVEQMVGSIEHGYAGRPDLRAGLTDFVDLNTTPSRFRATFDPGVHLFDLKTSSAVYDTHYMQLEAYDWANIECGYGDSDVRAVIRVTKDGLYEVKKSRATFSDFLAVKALYDALGRIKGKK